MCICLFSDLCVTFDIQCVLCVYVCVRACVLPVASWSCVSRLTLVAQQLPFFTQVASGAEAVAETTLLLLFLLKLLMDPVALSQRGEGDEGEEEEEERTEPS